MTMETQLEIVCNGNTTSNKDSTSNSTQQWLGLTFQNILNKLRESHHKHVEDDWEIPFERIRMCHNDFQRCGSQGDVFYGKLSNTPVAVKRVKDVALTRIKHLKELNHKNIIKFRGISENSNFYYILMEWCPYGTLHDHLHSGRQLGSRILSDFALQIANGMKYLHSKNIIHRDLKPSNILLTHNDVLKISDFGTHKVFNKLPVTSITYAGTHAYMAPEVIRGEIYSFPVDVWSYGVVLWEILIGEEPYKNLNSSAVVWAVGNNSFRLPIPSSFPEGFNRILNGCWKTQPRERLTFKQICMILKGAMSEVDKISKERWLPLQAEWKREIRDELNKQLQFKEDSNEDQLCQQKLLAYEEALEKAQKTRKKNNDLYLRLQECCLHLQRDREENQREREALKKAREEATQREESLKEREESLSKREQALHEAQEELKKREERLREREQMLLKQERPLTPSDSSEETTKSPADDKETTNQ